MIEIIKKKQQKTMQCKRRDTFVSLSAPSAPFLLDGKKEEVFVPGHFTVAPAISHTDRTTYKNSQRENFPYAYQN